MERYVHTVLEAGGPRSGCLCAQVWWGLSSWPAEGHLLAASLPLLIGTHPFLSPKSQDQLPPHLQVPSPFFLNSCLQLSPCVRTLLILNPPPKRSSLSWSYFTLYTQSPPNHKESLLLWHTTPRPFDMFIIIPICVHGYFCGAGL